MMNVGLTEHEERWLGRVGRTEHDLSRGRSRILLGDGWNGILTALVAALFPAAGTEESVDG